MADDTTHTPPELPAPTRQRAAFEAWAREHRKDLDLRYMYDESGQYHHDGYIWGETGDAWRCWQAALAAARPAEQPQEAVEVHYDHGPQNSTDGMKLSDVARLLQSMVVSARPLVDADGETVVGYKIKTGSLHRLVGMFPGTIFPSNLPSEPAAPQPPQQVQEGVVPVDLAKEREFCDREFNASKYMQVVHAPQHFQAYWDGWQAAINVRGATDWRARAIEAETTLRHMSRALAEATNGPTFMGEPAAQQPAVPEGWEAEAQRYAANADFWREKASIWLHEWAVSRWRAEVQNRPLVNVHRRSLDDVWRQVIRFAGGDPDAVLGPSHDAMLAASPTPPQAEQGANDGK